MTVKLPKIFLDSGDPEETRKAKGLLSNLDGQTTNPSLVAKNPDVVKYLESGKRLTEAELLGKYKEIIAEISTIISGPISVEVYADWESTASDMLRQAEDMGTWARNVYMKFPTTTAGVQAARDYTANGGKVNMTLVFDQVQAAAVFEATKQTQAPAFVSPFIGRWDDRGFDGLDLVRNILKQYKKYEKKTGSESHVKVLAASVRHLDHLYSCIFMKADIITMPLPVVYDWIQDEKWVPDDHYRYKPDNLKNMVYQQVDPGQPLESYTIPRVEGDLLDEGLKKFAADWKKLIQ